MAVIECKPAPNDEVAKVATSLPLSIAVPRVELPSLNVTMPVGVPGLPPPATVAVKVTV